MKILHIISSSGLYGAENVVLNLARLSQQQKNAIVYLICLKNVNKPDPEIYKHAKVQGVKVEVFSCRSKLDFKVITRIKKFIICEKIQIVHCHNYKSNVYGLIAARLAQRPVITTVHGWTAEDKKVRLYEMLDKWIISKMEHLVAVSPAIASELNRRGLGNKTTIISNGIDTNKFNPSYRNEDLRAKFKVNGNFVIGCVGRLSTEKGHRYLIRAFKDVHSKIPNTKLLIVGDGYLKEGLKKEVRNLKLAENVIFAGKQENMPSVYKLMNIFVLPSITEGLPLVLLEAMSMNIPIIATNTGGISYVVSKQEGIIVPAQNCKELQRALLLLLNDAQLRKRLGAKARKKVLASFSLNSSYHRYHDIYNYYATN